MVNITLRFILLVKQVRPDLALQITVVTSPCRSLTSQNGEQTALRDFSARLCRYDANPFSLPVSFISCASSTSITWSVQHPVRRPAFSSDLFATGIDLATSVAECEHGAVPKRLIRGVIKAVAGIAVVVFILARFTTNTGMLLFVGSVVVLLACFGRLRVLEGDDENTGYWPRGPRQ